MTMDEIFTGLAEGVLVPLIDALVVPIAGSVPALASSGLLFAVFAALWIAFGIALVRRRGSLDAAWTRIRGLPLAFQGLAWLLFLPVLVALWVWRTSWPAIARVAVIGGLAGWNLLVFVPRPS
jgi:hypothetical protein